jgi:S1-C subfamily serine protease
VRAGVVVASTVAGSIDAREGGLAAGDVVFGVNGLPVTSVAELRTAIEAFKEGDAIVLQLERRGELMYLAFALE